MAAALAAVISLQLAATAPPAQSAATEHVTAALAALMADTAAPEVPAAHASAVAKYWQERSDAFAAGPDRGVDWIVSRLHPDLAKHADRCRRAFFPKGIPDGYTQTVTLHESTVIADPDWQMPFEPLAGEPPFGSVYSMIVTLKIDGLPSNVAVERPVRTHLAVIDGVAYGFAACYLPTVAAPPGGATDPIDATTPTTPPSTSLPPETGTATSPPPSTTPQATKTELVLCARDAATNTAAFAYTIDFSDAQGYDLLTFDNAWDDLNGFTGGLLFGGENPTTSGWIEELSDASSVTTVTLPSTGQAVLRRLDTLTTVSVTAPSLTVNLADCPFVD